MAIVRLLHIGLCVADLEHSLRFYRDALGFEERSRLDVAGEPAERLLGLADVKLRAVYLERDGTRLELLHFEAPEAAAGAGSLPRPMNHSGLTHLSLRVDDLDATLRTLERAGARVLRDTRIELPAMRTAAVFVLDPDGTRIELVEGPAGPGLEPGREPRP